MLPDWVLEYAFCAQFVLWPLYWCWYAKKDPKHFSWDAAKHLGGFGVIWLAATLWYWWSSLPSYAWAAPGDWRSVRCKVLAAGASCRETVWGGACLELRREGNRTSRSIGPTFAKGTSGPILFDLADLAACPGTYWCASEGSPCTCDGHVDFAMSIWDGTGYNDPGTRVRSSGTIQCSTKKNGGPFAQDPAPFREKQCWCTPDVILRQLHREGASTQRDQCAKEANSDYRAAKASSTTGQAQANFALAAGGAGEDEGATSRGFLASNVSLVSSGGTSNQLTPVYNFMPWALVEVMPDSDPVPGSTDDAPGARTPSAPVVRCAYPFAAPEATKGDWVASGFEGQKHPDGIDTGIFPGMAKRWAEEGTVACHVRAAGRASDDQCEVAMEPLELLTQEKTTVLTWGFGIDFVCLFLAFMCYTYSKFLVEGREGEDGGLGADFVDPLLAHESERPPI